MISAAPTPAFAALQSVPANDATPSGKAEPDQTGARTAKVVKKKKIGTKDKKGHDKDEAQSADNAPRISNESGRLEGEIVVMGIRENVKSARSVKRHAQQIVDVVVAQDIGKLPDKNVAEALARVPGVQIDRARGEGGKVLIRGLGNVMTTVNGSPTFSDVGRTTSLNDISSDLVAGIEVYKTRTPDQVEGSQTGVVNLTLRRPTDFKEGATYALSTRFDYSDRIKEINPYYSALIAYNGDTALGRMGFSVNGTWNRVGYHEDNRFNAQPDLLSSFRQQVFPVTIPARIYAPSDVGFSGNSGVSKRAAFQISSQWKPDDHWNVTLEGGYSNRRGDETDSDFTIPISYSTTRNAPPTLSNVVLADDGRLVKSATLTGLDPIGPGRYSFIESVNGYNARLQVQYSDDRAELTSWINYNKVHVEANSLYHALRFNQRPQIDLVFNDKDDPLGGVRIDFRGADLLDPQNYLYIDKLNQYRINRMSSDVEIKSDLKLNTFLNFIDYLKVGFRYNKRSFSSYWATRRFDGLRLPIALLPDYKLSPFGDHFQRANTNWLIGDSQAIRTSFPRIRALLTPIYRDFDTPYPKNDPYWRIAGSEAGYAVYGQFHYNLKLFVPVEGIIGARMVNSLTMLRARRHLERLIIDDQGYNRWLDTDMVYNPQGNALDILPSANAIAHITPKLQLRLAYTYDVQRPEVGLTTPALNIQIGAGANRGAAGGNPNLKPFTTQKYDASLEWYFGTTGTASLGVWQWDQENLIANRTLPEYLPEMPDVPTLVTRPYNVNSGRHRGIEGQFTTFFTFLPGILKSFGTSINGTLAITRVSWLDKDKDDKDIVVFGPILDVSKYTYNLIGFFERGGLNVRVAYNWQSRRQWRLDGQNPYLNQFRDPIERLDAAINYDVNKHLTIGLEASNLTRDGIRSYWGSYDVPNDVRYFSRNYAFSLRARL
jgi:TonB-dependent receptor